MRTTPAATIGVALLLSACQQAPVAPTDFTRADQIQRWEMSGKLGYRTANDGGSATFDWRQQPQRGTEKDAPRTRRSCQKRGVEDAPIFSRDH